MSTQTHGFASLIAGGKNYGAFDVHEGGAVTAEVIRHRSGGSLNEETIGTPPTVEPITLRRLYKNARDQAAKRELQKLVGATGQAVIGLQDTDERMQPFGSPDKRTGTIASVKGPDRDSTSNDKAWLEIVVELDSPAP